MSYSQPYGNVADVITVVLRFFFFFFNADVISTGLNGQLQLAEVPLVHVVVPHQFVTAGKLLLAVGPPAVKGLLT